MNLKWRLLRKFACYWLLPLNQTFPASFLLSGRLIALVTIIVSTRHRNQYPISAFFDCNIYTARIGLLYPL